MHSQSVILLLLVSFACIGASFATELGDVFRSNNVQSQSSQASSQPESSELLAGNDYPKWKRGINLGRKMMCQIDQRNCGSFNEAKRFNQQPKINYNVLAYLLKNNMQNAEAMSPFLEDK